VLSPVPPSEGRTLAPLIDMKEIETRAADLVVAELGALRWELRDSRELGVQMRDFDIVFADGHEEPLEVTTSADSLVVNTMQRMEGKNRIPWLGPRSWVTSAPYTSTDAAGKKTAFDRRRCVALLVPFIERLERDGHESFDTTSLAYAFHSPYQPVPTSSSSSASCTAPRTCRRILATSPRSGSTLAREARMEPTASPKRWKGPLRRRTTRRS
jgi:hypothetical protein